MDPIESLLTAGVLSSVVLAVLSLLDFISNANRRFKHMSTQLTQLLALLPDLNASIDKVAAAVADLKAKQGDDPAALQPVIDQLAAAKAKLDAMVS